MKRLEHYFPVAERQYRPDVGHSFATHPEDAAHDGKVTVAGICTKWRAIMSLELQGVPKNEIATRVGMSAGSISNITLDPRYIEYRDAYLASIDGEFFAMKPLAFDALRKGLTSNDEDTALKAADMWFRGGSFGGFSKRDEPAKNLTAEDVVRQLLQREPVVQQVNVQVNVGTDD